jgi:hypothetical protein
MCEEAVDPSTFIAIKPIFSKFEGYCNLPVNDGVGGLTK